MLCAYDVMATHELYDNVVPNMYGLVEGLVHSSTNATVLNNATALLRSINPRQRPFLLFGPYRTLSGTGFMLKL